MRQRTGAGYTLLELLMVVAILSIVALVAVPVSQRVTEAGADVALDHAAHALRLARDDARRSGEQRLLTCDTGANTITVGAVDTVNDTSAPSQQAARAALHVAALGAAPAGSAMRLVSCSFTFTDNTSAATVVFNSAGSPVRGIGKGPARDKTLRAGSIVLEAGHVRRTVHLAVTGRITLS